MSRSRPRPYRAAVALLLLAAGPCAASDLLVEVEGDRVVFTNTPSRPDARPLPGMGSGAARVSSPALPSTIYDAFIERVAQDNGLSPALIKAVAVVESGLDPRAVSPKGAQGLMQLMPETARQYGVEDPFDPLQNLRAGASHLRALVEEFDGDTSLALAAYNAGAAAVRRNGGVPYRETVDYVRRVQERLGRRRRVPRPDSGRNEVRLVRKPDGSVLLAN